MAIINRSEDYGKAGQRNHKKSRAYFPRSISEQYSPGKKEGWGKSSLYKLKSSQQVYSIQAFQNGRFALLEIPSQDKRFSLQDRSEKCHLSVPLCMSSRKFVIFAWSRKLYDFLHLCFGLGPAPRIFSKLLKVSIALLRLLNIPLVIYHDDILLMGRTLEGNLMSRDTLIFLLQHLSFVINLKKSVQKPSEQVEFLGLKTHTHTMTLAI